MSKKKSFSGSTMTLKDFHGGSILTDISLPSAPGMIARPADRPGYDRQSGWGNQMGRSDHRLLPSSPGSLRNLDDKTPFLPSTAHIGRNFEEDERKPLDGSSGPRRTVSDEGIRAPLMRSEIKGDVGKLGGQQGFGNLLPQVGVGVRSYSGKVVEGGHVGVSVSSPPLSGNGSGSGSFPNAWGVRKEAVSVPETVSSLWSGQSATSKFAQASALDQISSGRWQTKPPQRVDVEVIRQSDSLNSLHGRENDSYGSVNFVGEIEHHETTVVRHVERGLAIEECIRGSPKGMLGVQKVHSPGPLDGKERASALYTNERQPVHPDGKYRRSETHVPSGVSERPKLKLLPRTKPLDVLEPTAVNYKQEFQQLADAGHPRNGGNISGNASLTKSGPTSSEASDTKPAISSIEAGNKLVERPKLNLKLRSQPIDQSDINTETERMAVFSGARRQEMVLKECGVDDVINSHDEVQSPSRIKSDVPRTEVAPAHAKNTAHPSERIKNFPVDHRTGRGIDKREQRAEVQKSDVQRTNWRNENRRNSRDIENHPRQGRQPSPETWRKPAEQPNPSNSNTSGLRFGKAVSAVELAQAFSKPVSGPKSIDQLSSQRGTPGRTQVPFSRLTGPPTRPQINGY